MSTREIRAIVRASEELRCKNMIIITWDYEDETRMVGRKIRTMPLWRWLKPPGKPSNMLDTSAMSPVTFKSRRAIRVGSHGEDKRRC